MMVYLSQYTLSLLTAVVLVFAALTWSAQTNPVGYSDLSIVKRRAIERRITPPPVSERDNPYATPMYYLLCRGYRAPGSGSLARGGVDTFELTRNRPDLQAQLLRDWAELGITGTHFLSYPDMWKEPAFQQGVRDYLDISAELGMTVSFRLGGLEGKAWPLHPDNPDNTFEQYLAWVDRVVRFAKGHVHHYILGDEINNPSYVEYWNPDNFMKVFVPVSERIKAIDPQVGVSGPGLAGIDWPYVSELFDLGYLQYADGIAANFRDYPAEVFNDFVNRVRAVQPDLPLWSNGLHWVGTRQAVHHPASDTNPAWVFADDEGQAIVIAQRMFKLFDVGWNNAPYYVIVRHWVTPDGKRAPIWYGFYGLQDLVMDEYGNMTIKRYPGWYAYQTLAQIFWSQSRTVPARFDMRLSTPVDFARIYERNDYECLIVLWNNPACKNCDENDAVAPPAPEPKPNEMFIPAERIPDMDTAGKTTHTSLTLDTDRYRYPVQVSLFNYRQLTDLPHRMTDAGRLVIENVHVASSPVIIRLVAEP